MPVVKLKVGDQGRPLEDLLSTFQTMTGFDIMYFRRENEFLAVFMTSMAYSISVSHFHAGW